MQDNPYIEKNQLAGTYHIFNDEIRQCWGPFYSMQDALEMLKQIAPETTTNKKPETRDNMQTKLNRLRAIIEVLSETVEKLEAQTRKLKEAFGKLQSGEEVLPLEEQKQCFEALREGEAK